MKKALLGLTCLLTLSANASCPDFSGTYSFSCDKLVDHHSTFSHPFITPQDADGKAARIEIKQTECSKIAIDNLDDSFPEYFIYLQDAVEGSESIEQTKLKTNDNSISVKYRVQWGGAPLASGHDRVHASLERLKNGQVEIKGKVKIASFFSFWIPIKEAKVDCTLIKH